MLQSAYTFFSAKGLITMAENLKEMSFAPEDTPTLYFVDGFHGGIKGHMPQGSMADILNGLENNPDWKVTLEVEPISFDWLKKHEPETFYRLKEYVEADYDDIRVEIASGSHAQAFSWAISGESVIRQLTMGMKYVKESFPKAVVDTYAVQEPCWTSSLPQILNSLGFKRAVLKNSTCWGGYTKGIDKEIVFWVGPDGSRIACVPRYECEDLIFCWAIQGSGYDKPAMDKFPQKCVDKGIKHPAAIEFQDLGWRGLPWVHEKYQKYTTWREYFDKIADKPEDEWKFSQEDILVSLPWGEKTINKMSRQVRESENKLVQTEKLASLANIKSGFKYPERDINEAWYQLLLSQHHDAWICAPCGQWAKKAEFQTSFSDNVSAFVQDDALWAINENEVSVKVNESKTQFVRVFNSTGSRRQGLTEVMITVPEGTESVEVIAPNGASVPCRASVIRRARGNNGALHLSFIADVPAMGYATYKVCHGTGNKVEEMIPMWGNRGGGEVNGDTLVIENDILSITLDLKKGGTFSSLIDKRDGTEYVDTNSEFCFNEYRGYHIESGEFVSTKDVTVTARVFEKSELRTTAMIEGKLCDQYFKTFIRLEKGSDAISFQNQFFFKPDTKFGNPWVIPPERGNLEYKKADHDDRYKLHAVFPTSFKNDGLYKESAFNVEKSKLDDTFFMGWDQIKHKVMVHWVDSFNESENRGLALYCDHTNGYQFGADYPLGITLAYGGQSGFWWGNCRLDGMQETRYSIIPHADKWDGAKLYSLCESINEPLVTRTFSTSKDVEKEYSAIDIKTDGVILSAMTVTDKGLLVRVFGAENDGKSCVINTGFDFKSVKSVSPSGENLPESESFDISAKGREVTLPSFPRFAIRTILFEM